MTCPRFYCALFCCGYVNQESFCACARPMGNDVTLVLGWKSPNIFFRSVISPICPILKAVVTYGISCSYLTGVPAAELRGQPSNMKVMKRTGQIFCKINIPSTTKLTNGALVIPPLCLDNRLIAPMPQTGRGKSTCIQSQQTTNPVDNSWDVSSIYIYKWLIPTRPFYSLVSIYGQIKMLQATWHDIMPVYISMVPFGWIGDTCAHAW